MKIKLALVTLLIPTAVFAQAGKSGENAGYQGTTSATQGLGASNPNAGKGKSGENAGYQGTTSATQGLGSANPNAGGVATVPPSTVGGGPGARGSGAPQAPISVDPRPVR
jgi:hypothetical protein